MWEGLVGSCWCIVCAQGWQSSRETLCFQELCHHPKGQPKLDSELCMVRAEVRMSSPGAVLTTAVNNSPKGNYPRANAAPHSRHCVPSAEPWPQDKGSWKWWMGPGAMAGTGGAAPAGWVCGRTVKWCQIESCFWSLIMIFCDVRYLVVFFFKILFFFFETS